MIGGAPITAYGSISVHGIGVTSTPRAANASARTASSAVVSGFCSQVAKTTCINRISVPGTDFRFIDRNSVPGTNLAFSIGNQCLAPISDLQTEQAVEFDDEG